MSVSTEAGAYASASNSILRSAAADSGRMFVVGYRAGFPCDCPGCGTCL